MKLRASPSSLQLRLDLNDLIGVELSQSKKRELTEALVELLVSAASEQYELAGGENESEANN